MKNPTQCGVRNAEFGIKTALRLVLVLVLVLAGGRTARCQTTSLPLLSVNPPPGRTNAVGGRIITNVVLTWDAYTNAWFEVMGCTNLANPRWYHVTNVPVTHTSQAIPVTQQQEFFKVCTRCNSSITINH